MTEKMPWEQIKDLYDERAGWSDEAVLAELGSLEVLPDESGPEWDSDDTWKKSYLYVALSDLAAVRHLVDAIPLLYQRASYGDPGEIMRDLRHCMEGLVNSDWATLARLSMEAASYPQKGARQWALSQLAILREAVAFDTAVAALDDEAQLVRWEACRAISMICQTNPQCRESAIAALKDAAGKTQDERDLDQINREIDYISAMK